MKWIKDMPDTFQQYMHIKQILQFKDRVKIQYCLGTDIYISSKYNVVISYSINTSQCHIQLVYVQLSHTVITV